MGLRRRMLAPLVGLLLVQSACTAGPQIAGGSLGPDAVADVEFVAPAPRGPTKAPNRSTNDRPRDPAPFGTGTVWYSDFGELRKINASHPTERPLVFSFGILDTFTVNAERHRFTSIDDSFDFEAGEPRNQVVVRSTGDIAPKTRFRWGDQCMGEIPNRVDLPLESPSGDVFIAATGYLSDIPDTIEVRTDIGDCVFVFDARLFSSWSWMANGDLLAVMDATSVSAVDGDGALVTLPRVEIAEGEISTMQLLRSYAGPDLPSGPVASKAQDQVAYTYDHDLYVLDIDAGEHHRVAQGPGEMVWPAFSPDDTSIIVRHRTEEGDSTTPSRGEVHVVDNHREAPVEIASDGPTVLEVPARKGDDPRGFDAKGPFFWG